MEQDRPKTILVECSTCKSGVAANSLAEARRFNDFSGITEFIYLLRCPKCEEPLVGCGYVELEFEGELKYPSKIVRIWPNPQKDVSTEIPNLVRSSLEEANRCYNAKAYNACVVMCGRALEAICRDHAISMKSLVVGLKELRESKIIDGRLYDWGEALREARNIGAHANDTDTTSFDARDVLEFTNAICEYIYVLSNKYDAFKKRQLRRSSKAKNKV